MLDIEIVEGTCPHCHSKNTVKRALTKVLTSYPPQSEYHCTNCGKVWSAHNNEEALKCSTEGPTMSITNIGTGTFGWGQTGWICPRCGKVLAPNQYWCPFCDNGGNNTITITPTCINPTKTGYHLPNWATQTTSIETRGTITELS